MTARINFDRFRTNIKELAEIGSDPAGGVSRPSFSKSDFQAREWLKKKIEEAGLDYRQDGAGNIFGRIEGQGKTVMSGSHIDTVVNGGIFDGSIGVLGALECLQRIREENLSHSKPLEAAAFTDEEGNLAGDFLGSRAFIGGLDPDVLEKRPTQVGPPLPDILENTGLSIGTILEASGQRPDLEAFIELHIEQGPVLEMEGKSIGIVDRIAGKKYWNCSFTGQASHAGTTPFELRRDAFLGLADFSLKSTHYVATHHYGSLLTIGRIDIRPGTFSVVPGRVDFTLDFRSTSEGDLSIIEKKCIDLAEDIAATRGLQFHHSCVDRTDPVLVPKRIRSIIKEESEALNLDFMELPSGAGHDAQILSCITDSGMIFIPCEDGISHSPEENIQWEDLEKGANLLLNCLLRLAR